MDAAAFVSECLTPLSNLFLGMIGSIVGLYTTQIILTAVFALWIFKKIVGIFELIKP